MAADVERSPCAPRGFAVDFGVQDALLAVHGPAAIAPIGFTTTAPPSLIHSSGVNT